ncbi:hypothetical protein [uncultured Jatrophihabitans sp.]|uniref:hypothetical protein n=1 Tax=uncultured Jatrophihabitans sp. TaxID=1610747 RepID=UPI0035CBF2D3
MTPPGPNPQDEPDNEPVLPSVTRDELDEGWGDERSNVRDEDWYRRERPPHHE